MDAVMHRESGKRLGSADFLRNDKNRNIERTMQDKQTDFSSILNVPSPTRLSYTMNQRSNKTNQRTTHIQKRPSSTNNRATYV